MSGFASFVLGCHFQAYGYHECALVAFEKAMQAMRNRLPADTTVDFSLACTHMKLGMMHSSLNHDSEAKRNFDQAFAMCQGVHALKQEHTLALLVNIMSGMGEMLSKSGQHKIASVRFEQATNLTTQLEDFDFRSILKSNILRNRAIAESRANKTDLAIQRHKDSLVIHGQLRLTVYAARALESVSELLFCTRPPQFEAVKENLQQALAVLNGIDFENLKSMGIENPLSCETSKMSIAEEVALSQFRKTVGKTVKWKYTSKILKALATTSRELGDHESADRNLQSADLIDRSILRVTTESGSPLIDQLMNRYGLDTTLNPLAQASAIRQHLENEQY